MIALTVFDGPLDVATPAVLATTSTIVPMIARPSTQPPRKARPLLRALGVMSMRMMAMIGTGLMAMPIASGRISPMAWVTTPPSTAERRRRALPAAPR